MTAVRRRRIRGRTYYYLVHSVRIGGRVQSRERYLGRTLPRDLESIRRGLLAEIRAEKWHPQLAQIRSAYHRERAVLPKEVLRQEINRFGVKFTYNSNRIEGSSLTLRETAGIIERGVAPRSKPLSDVLEAMAHHRVFLAMLSERGPLTLPRVLGWHQALFKDTKPALAGLVRTYLVGIGGSRFVPPAPDEVPILLRQLFRWYANSLDKVHPVELAAILHLRFETIHPFGDGNGRVGRLMMNYVLDQAEFPMFDLPFGRRESYYEALERSHTESGELSFLEWFLRMYVALHRPKSSRLRRARH